MLKYASVYTCLKCEQCCFNGKIDPTHFKTTQQVWSQWALQIGKRSITVTVLRVWPGFYFICCNDPMISNAFQQQCSTNTLHSQALSWVRRIIDKFFVNNWLCYWCWSLIGNGCSSLVCKHSFVPALPCHTYHFLCSFSNFPKLSEGINWTMKFSEPQFTGLFIIQSNPLSESLCLGGWGCFITTFHNVHEMTDFFILFCHCLLNVRVVSLSLQPLSVRSVEWQEWLSSPVLSLKLAKTNQIDQWSVIFRPAVSFKCPKLRSKISHSRLLSSIDMQTVRQAFLGTTV